ncbi:hypothetical protein Q0Z83_009660 [Actinoplanes sichuanensis]|uniref:Dynamin family protein n=1 Tax=Actinoplanes sichuanensis TaxID=512349 RepID=A0ABW4AEZ4_9ACTN|nr:hypothetical protein [Actinoplanes sichuanensis]BEL02775.1 hypothetical protein Q0Z83_009660 [Actinoplanes sichuanensis]
MPTPAISEFADRFDPETSPVSLGVLGQLDRAVGRAFRDDLCARLQRAAAALAEPEVRVTLGGRAGSGRSSLLHVLIGRALPADPGHPYTIRAGRADELLGPGGGRFADFDRAVIAEHGSLLGGSAREVSHLAVTVRGDGVPGGLLLADAPGIGADLATDGRAAAVAHAGDLLLWVTDSRRPLSRAELDHLGGHLDTHGPHSIVFVVNAFLDADTGDGWQRFQQRVAPFYRRRIAEAADELGADPPSPVFVSARAAAGHPGRFGGPELRDLLADLAAGHRATVATRLFRAEQALTDLAVDLNRRTAVAEEATAFAAAEHAARLLTTARGAVSETPRSRSAAAAVGQVGALHRVRDELLEPLLAETRRLRDNA